MPGTQTGTRVEATEKYNVLITCGLIRTQLFYVAQAHLSHYLGIVLSTVSGWPSTSNINQHKLFQAILIWAIPQLRCPGDLGCVSSNSKNCQHRSLLWLAGWHTVRHSRVARQQESRAGSTAHLVPFPFSLSLGP